MVGILDKLENHPHYLQLKRFFLEGATFSENN